MAVSIDHARAVRSLPWHPRDPFDRLLVAQATLEDAVLLSNDERARLRPTGRLVVGQG